MKSLNMNSFGTIWSTYQRPLLLAALLAVGGLYGSALALDISPLLLLAAPLLVVGGLVTLRRPEFAAAAMICISWGLLSDVAVRYHGLPSILKPLIGVLVLILLSRRFIVRDLRLVYDPSIWLVLAFLLVVSLGTWYARDTERAYDRTIDLFKDVTLFFVVINLINSPKILRLTLYGLLALGALLGTLSVVQEVTHTYNSNYGGLAQMRIAFIADGLADRPRASGTSGDPNTYGQPMVVLVPIGLWAMFFGRTLVGRVAAGYATTAILAGIGLSFSRSMLLSVGVAVALYLIHIRLSPRFLLLAAPLLVGLLMIAPPEFTARLTTLENLLQGENGIRSEGALKGRSSEALMGIYMFADHPILGVGAANSPVYYPQYIRENGSPVQDEERHTHNYYVEIAAEHGLVGSLLFVGVVIMTWRRQRLAQRLFATAGDKRMAELAAALQCSFAGYLASAVFLHGVFPQYLWIQVALAVAMALIAKKQIEMQPRHAVTQ